MYGRRQVADQEHDRGVYGLSGSLSVIATHVVFLVLLEELTQCAERVLRRDNRVS